MTILKRSRILSKSPIILKIRKIIFEWEKTINQCQHQADTHIGIIWQGTWSSHHTKSSKNNYKHVWNKWKNRKSEKEIGDISKGLFFWSSGKKKRISLWVSVIFPAVLWASLGSKYGDKGEEKNQKIHYHTDYLISLPNLPATFEFSKLSGAFVSCPEL